ncbi:transporter [Methylobacter luteus]|uniref:transporter n=1 Tax=Methylobacter luteus TaxID=415 RepID=UPI000481F441|nr:transporter [Methylobacter luteus]
MVRFAAVCLAVMASDLHGQELEPRTYANTPVGLNFLIAGYGHLEGGVAIDPALPIENTQVEVHSAAFAYVRSLDFLGKSAKFDVVLPYAWASVSATALGQLRERDVSGLADPRARFSVNLYGAPALSLEDFKNYQQDTIIGASLEVTAPGGQYDAGKLLNLGTNRWSVKPEVGISKNLGPVTLELIGGVRFYTDNDDFFGGKVREQDPIYSMRGHLIYSFSHGIWAALDGTFYTGGQTTVDGIKRNNRLENTRLGATLALPITRYNSVKLYFSTGVSTRAGTNFDAAGIVWQYRFGGGL